MPTHRSSTTGWYRYSRSMCGSMRTTSTTATSGRGSLRRCCPTSSTGISWPKTSTAGASSALTRTRRAPERPSLRLEAIAGPEDPPDHGEADQQECKGGRERGSERHVCRAEEGPTEAVDQV